MASPRKRPLREVLFAPVDGAFLVFFRVAFAAIMLWEVWRYFTMDRIARYYIDAPFHFKYYGFTWVEAWPGDGMYWHFHVLGACAVAMLIGCFYRLAALLFFLGFSYVFLLDQARYLNHFYLVSLVSFLMVLVPAHRAWSVDALWRPRLRSRTVPAWSLYLLRAQIGIVYFYGGLAKLGPDWLQGEPLRMWLAERSHYPVLGPYLTQEWVVLAFAYGGLLFDLLVVPLLLWRRTRWFAFLWALAFHGLNAWLFDIGIFPWFMLCATLVFFPPDFPRRVWSWIRRLGGPAAATLVAPAPAASPVSTGWTPGRRLLVGGLGVYLLFQLVFPFRHLAYKGDVNWTEEGHRFSWRMKLRTKDGETTFLIKQPATGRFWEFDPEGDLDPKQVEEMATRPDMILQYAHFLADAMRRKGRGEVEVHARSMVSLNGRPPQLLIDPAVDLARVERSLRPSAWILPLTGELRTKEERNTEASVTAHAGGD